MIFAIIGAITIITFLHEMVHRSDYKDIVSKNSSIYLYRFSLDFDQREIGFFLIFVDDEKIMETPEFIRIRATTEDKALKWTFLILAIFIFFFIMFLAERRELFKSLVQNRNV